MKIEAKGEDGTTITAERVSGHVRISIGDSEIILNSEEHKKFTSSLKII